MDKVAPYFFSSSHQNTIMAGRTLSDNFANFGRTRSAVFANCDDGPHQRDEANAFSQPFYLAFPTEKLRKVRAASPTTAEPHLGTKTVCPVYRLSKHYSPTFLLPSSSGLQDWACPRYLIALR